MPPPAAFLTCPNLATAARYPWRFPATNSNTAYVRSGTTSSGALPGCGARGWRDRERW